MASIEIRRFDGQVESRLLTKSQPVSVGRHTTCDVRVDEEGVGVLHCRISWNRTAYEVTSAQPDGVDVNGQLVRHLMLSEGDVIRVGTFDIVARVDSPRDSGRRKSPKSAPPVTPGSAPDVEASPEQEQSAEVGLAPVSEELPLWKQPSARLSSRMLEAKEKEPAERESSVKSSPSPAPPHAAPPAAESEEPEIVAEDLPSAEVIPTAEIALPKRSRSSTHEPPAAAAPVSPLSRQPRRPGERDPLRSPLVLGIGGGTIALLLASVVVWFMISRNAIQKEYDLALDDLAQGRYAQAAERFEKFLQDHPRHGYRGIARVGLGKARIEREIGGAAANWRRGLDSLNEFIDERRDDAEFSELHPDIARYAERIALGAAKSSEGTKKRELLPVSEEARKLLLRFAPADRDIGNRQRAIDAAVAAAESAILRQETVDASIAEMIASLDRRQAIEVLQSRRRLLDKYPDAADGARLKPLIEKTLEIEKEAVTREDGGRDALTQDLPAVVPTGLVLAPHPRSRTDLASDGRTVVALAKDSCFGIDAVTGNPLWQRSIGFDTPFFPLAVSGAQESFLVFDTVRSELVRLDRRTGALRWRLPLGAGAVGGPLIHEGQVYLALRDQSLARIDLEAGRQTSRLKFSQRIAGPPALVAKNARLVVAGEADLLYTLTLRPLECERVTFLGHRAGAIVAPLTPMGSLLLVAENDRQASAQLRALKASEEKPWLSEAGSVRVVGQVRDVPMLRGNELYVPTGNERIAVFVASDMEGKAPLTPAALFQSPQARPGPMFLSLGADGQLWLAGHSLRRLQRKAEVVAVDGPSLAEGISTQPLQLLGKTLFVGRRQSFSMAVLFTEADREEMTSSWRTVLGAAPIGVLPAGDALVLVSEQGDVFRIGHRELTAGGFRLESQAQLKLPEKLREPLQAWKLGDDSLAVAAGGAEPVLWIVNRSGLIEREVRLESPLEAPPVVLAAGLVLPLAKRLRVLSASGSPVEDFLPDVDVEESPKWRHLIRLDDTQLLAIDSRQRMSRIQFRSTPVPHLAEVAHVELASPVDVSPAIAGTRVLVAGADRKLRSYETATLETAVQTELDLPASQPLWSLGGMILVEAGRKSLSAYSPEALRPLWSLPVDTALAGPPALRGGRLLVATQSGELHSVSPETGAIRGKVSLSRPLASGPVAVEDKIVVGTVDGSWLNIEAVAQP